MSRRRKGPIITPGALALGAAIFLVWVLSSYVRLSLFRLLLGVLVLWLVAWLILRLFQLRITFAGVIFSAITTFVMMAAISSQTNLLFWALGLMMGGLVISGALSWVMLKSVDVKRIVEEAAVAGLPANVHYVLTNGKKSWPAFAVRVREAGFDGALSSVPDGFCLHASPMESRTMMTQMIAAKRGRLKLREIEVSCAFPFGFLSQTVCIEAEREVVVYPRIGLLDRRLAMRYREVITSGTMTSSVRGGADEFYGLREYRPGDSVRSIAWKRSARTGEMVVREMTSNAPPQMMVVLDIRKWREMPEEAGRAAVEGAIELAASLLCYGSMENFAIGLTIAGLAGQGDGGGVTTQMGREARSRMLSALARLEAKDVEAGGMAETPSRIARRAEWIVVTLRGEDEVNDLVPMGTSSTVMAMNDANAGEWVHFVTGVEAMRLLRGSAGGGGGGAGL